MARREFRVIVFFASPVQPRKYRKVSNFRGLGVWLNTRGFRWKYMNLYDQQTREYVERIYNPNQS
jgi:hypothetical protein